MPQCLKEIPNENTFCGNCGSMKVEKSNYEETMDLVKVSMKSERRMWFMIGFLKGIGHEVRDKKYINGLIDLWDSEERGNQ